MSKSKYTTVAKWADAIGAFKLYEDAAGIAPASVGLRVKHMRRFAKETAPLEPWNATYEEIRAWLDKLPCGRSTMMQHRTSLRAFYRWAHRSGRVFIDPTDEPNQRAVALPVPALWEPDVAAYRGFLRGNGKPESTVRSRMDHIRRFARAHASIAPWDLTLDDLFDYLEGHRWKSEYRRSVRGSLRSFFAWGALTDRIAENIALGIPVVKAGYSLPRPVNDDDLRDALSQAAPREHIAIRLAAELGLRRAEVACIHSKDVSGTVGGHVLLVHGKGNKERRIPLPAGIASLILDQPAGYLFPGDDHGHLSPRYLGSCVSQLLPPGVTMHALRHRFATRAYNIDRDVFTVQQLLGHASPATTQRYVQVSDDTMRRLTEAVAS